MSQPANTILHPAITLDPNNADATSSPSLPATEILVGIFETMSQGIIVWGDDLRCILVNQRAIHLGGVREADLHVGVHHKDYIASLKDLGHITAEQARNLHDSVNRRETQTFERSSRSGKTIFLKITPYSKQGFVVTMRDVTEERNRADELKQSIKIANEAREQLATNADQQNKRQTETALLSDLSEWLQTCKSLDELYEIVGKYISKALPNSSGELYVYSNSRDVLDGAFSWGEKAVLHNHIDPHSCWGLRRGRAYVFDTNTISFECAHVPSSEHAQFDRYICIPIVAHGDTVGLLHIHFDRAAKDCSTFVNPDSFTTKCGELISLAIANVRLRDELHEQSIRDPLTGLNNRRSCLEFLRLLISSHARQPKPFTIVSFDADRFKSFNDNYGHDAGDAVLQAIASEMMKEMVPGQLACRFGGEEFLMVLPDTGLEDGAKIADDLRDRVGRIKLQFAHQTLPSVTISCGVATFPQNADDIQSLIREADVALYRAKDAGRNRVEVAIPENP